MTSILSSFGLKAVIEQPQPGECNACGNITTSVRFCSEHDFFKADGIARADFLSLMIERGFPEDATAKIVRHADTRPGMDLEMLERGGWIE